MVMNILGFCLLFFSIIAVITVLCCAKVAGNSDRLEEERLRELTSKQHKETEK